MNHDDDRRNSLYGDRRHDHCTPTSCQLAANIAVKRVFSILGVNIDNPESVAEFQDDLRFGKRLRKLSERGSFAFVAAVVTAMVSAMLAGTVIIVRRNM